MRHTRRKFLQWASGVAATVAALPGRAGSEKGAVRFGDSAISLSFDERMHSAVAHLTRTGPTEFVRLSDGRMVQDFSLRERATESVTDGAHGAGTQLTLTGVSSAGLEKTVRVRLYDRYPGFALYRVSYRNISGHAVALDAWTNGAFEISALDQQQPQFWSYSPASYADRRDWVQPVKPGFAQENFLGMNASDYGGGTPVVDVWRRDCGLAVGHLAQKPELVALPIKENRGAVQIDIHAKRQQTLAPGQSFETLETFVAAHRGDYFKALDSYRCIMGERGLRAPPPPEASYEAIWCAWGYERECTVELIEGTLPKVRDLGLSWAVIDDGWQSNVGDWKLHPEKFPGGASDMRRLVSRIHDAGLESRLWWAPLAAGPGSDLLHDHTDMLLLDKEGAVQNVSWWNSFYLCPAYPKTVAYTLDLVRRFVGEWGHAGLKIDGQHLNGVAPCYNPAHRHARPEESMEQLPDFFRAIYATATRINPAAVIELCPCGTSYSFFDFPYINQAPASDPESSWQVRLKGKTLKALMGPSAPFAGDHVELSDHGDDFASTVGIGAVVSTKFTWPVDPKPKDSFLLTPEREKAWRRWISLYKDKMLPKGAYRGDLYDIGFDKPEAHVIERSGRTYYSFYASHWDGAVELRGLGPRQYRLRDYFNDRDLGVVSGSRPVLHTSFERFLLIEAIPT